MKQPVIKAVLAAALAVCGVSAASGVSAAGVASADTTSAQFTGTVSEIVDPDADTGIPRRWMRHVGNPAPDGYSHGYQWGTPAITTPAGVVTFTGTLDVDDAVAGDFGLIGLLDTATLAADERGLNEGSYIYAFMKNADTLVLGLSDGRAAGGEYVQVFHTINLVETGRIFDLTFTITPGNADSCASNPDDAPTAEGCLTLAVDGFGDLTDSYGTITNDDANGGVEFVNGGTAGWDGLASATAATGIDYNLTVTPTNGPRTKDDCKKGNWEAYGFKNQGQCVSSVVRP